MLFVAVTIPTPALSFPPRRGGVVVLLAMLLGAWTRPDLPTPAKRSAAPGKHLDYMVVKVNDEPRLVHDNEELPVLWGDKVEVSEALLVDRTTTPIDVNVVGYRSPSGRPAEDRGYPFLTHQLKAGYSEDRAGKVFAVTAVSGDVLHGVIFLRLVLPVLRYAEIKVNGAGRLLRDGEEISVHAKDQFKVDRVMTNLATNSDVLFHIVPAGEPGRFSIRFERDQRVFAAIPLRVLE